MTLLDRSLRPINIPCDFIKCPFVTCDCKMPYALHMLVGNCYLWRIKIAITKVHLEKPTVMKTAISQKKSMFLYKDLLLPLSCNLREFYEISKLNAEKYCEQPWKYRNEKLQFLYRYVLSRALYNSLCIWRAIYAAVKLICGKAAWIVSRLLVSPARLIRLSETKFLLAVNILRRRPVVQEAVGRPRASVFTIGNNPALGCGYRAVRRRLDGFSVVVDGWRLVECEDASATDDTAQWKIAVADSRLDRPHETSTTSDAVSARERLHRRRRRQAYYTLNATHRLTLRPPSLQYNIKPLQCAIIHLEE